MIGVGVDEAAIRLGNDPGAGQRTKCDWLPGLYVERLFAGDRFNCPRQGQLEDCKLIILILRGGLTVTSCLKRSRMRL